MGDRILLSIVIVIGPGKRNFLNLIDSIARSNYKNIELLVVDNSDNRKTTIKVKEKYPSAIIYKMPRNTGIFGYNMGYANAKGKYIVTLDDDCLIEKNTLEKIVNYFEREKKEVGILSFNVFNPILRKYEWTHYFREKSIIIPTFSGGACAFRKDILDKIGYYDESFFCWVHEDDLALRFMNQGYSIHFVRGIIINHYNIESIIRPKKLFLTFRNRAWLNMKHFSIWVWPLLVIRDISYGASLLYGSSIIKKAFYMFIGYLVGYLLFYHPISKRKVVRFSIQKKFLKNFYLRLLERL